ncbi:IPP transferase [Rosistilla carotiformis]|uniref:tRNA dimethylallyltransferase n=1 Tax=Rosistilla carotiformis TaxID=2528017 RepID=A0A518JV79_9BACT|nr:tRNA (adenosine(37)-N6)-dimethylallyltransferase MiaA [Rosistilla carotiformis]QDV69454.1 IPP transferase [Rosistilla carotiformis]
MGSPTTFPPLTQRAWFLTGPTASGKSTIAVCLAQHLDLEILSLDSMTVYRRMDLGTAKPAAALQQQTVHHLLDQVDPDTEFSAAQYLETAHAAVDQIVGRGKLPLFVGGTPLYLKACLRGFDAGPPADWEFRKAIEEELREHGAEALRARLQQVDPLSAHQLHPNDTRRMIRALEVARLTGQPISHRQVQFEASHSADEANVYALHWPRNLLHQRIDRRVEQMFADGLVDEVAAIRRDFPTISRTALQAVGYKEVFEFLDGTIDLSTTIDQVKAHTRQLARRQETWLRSMSEVQFIEMDEQRTHEDVAAEILQRSRDRKGPGTTTSENDLPTPDTDSQDSDAGSAPDA